MSSTVNGCPECGGRQFVAEQPARIERGVVVPNGVEVLFCKNCRYEMGARDQVLPPAPPEPVEIVIGVPEHLLASFDDADDFEDDSDDGK